MSAFETTADSRLDTYALDPHHWDDLRTLGHRMLDDMIDFLDEVRERPVWRPVPDEVKGRLHQPLPMDATTPALVYEQFVRDILPYPTGNIHPRFWGWVIGSGSPVGALAEFLAAGMNAHVGGYDQSAAIVEEVVLSWLKELLGFPDSATGLLVSGGTMANVTGLAVARTAKAGFDVREEGLRHEGRPALVLYGSTETHSSIQKAVELLGIGNRAWRRIGVDSDFRIDVRELADTIQRDRAQGLRPFCVVGNAGTVNTGAIDDLVGLADLCAEEELWLHVDGAFGALAYLVPATWSALHGLQRADSLAFDLHKWMYMPYEVGCVLVRHPGVQRSTFGVTPSYLGPTPRGIAAGGLPFADLGLELSRGFRALKVWMALKTYGVHAFARAIKRNIAQARYLAERVAAHPHLELLAPVSLNVVCFRYAAPGLDAEALDALNEEILLRVQESGAAVPSHTRLRGRFALRVAITNHRSRQEDFDLLVSSVEDAARSVLAGCAAPSFP